MDATKRVADPDAQKIIPEPGTSMITTVRVRNENGGT